MSTDDLIAGLREAPLVLIANDQEWTARAVETILVANGYRVIRSYTAGETLALAGVHDPDLVILDQQLPDYSGTELCRRLREDPRFGDSLPVIITTAGPSGRQQRLGAYEAGAWEFYGQPLDAEALLHKLKVYYESYRAVRRLREESLLDPATGLYSRTGLVRRATELLGEARRHGRAVACVGWSVPADTEPDQLDLLARTFRNHGRSADVLGRVAAGEFAVVAPATTREGAGRLAERFRALFVSILGDEDRVRSSVVALESDRLPQSGDQLLERLTPVMAV